MDMFLTHRRQGLLLVMFCLVFAFSVSAKDPEWRQITPRELSMDKPIVDPGADAEALFWEIRINDSKDTKLSRDNYVRIKIFTERGRESYSKMDIPFTKGYKIKNLYARVIRPDGSIVPIEEKDIFEKDILKANKLKIKAKSFAIPNIEPGVIVEYQYTEEIRGGGAVGMELEFQKDIPVHELSYFYKPYKKKKPDYKAYNFSDTEFVEDDKGYFRASRRNVPAFKKEPYMPPEGMVRPWMELLGFDAAITDVSAFSISYVIKDRSDPRKFWGAFATERQGRLEWITKKDKKIQEEAERITANISGDEAKLAALFDYCQKEIHNYSYDPTLTDDQRDDMPTIKKMSDILKEKKAPGYLVDYFFAALANSLGYEFALVYSGDRDEMFFKLEMTNEDFVHFSSVAVKAGNDWKHYNPGVPFLRPEQLVWNEQDTLAIYVQEKGGMFNTTPYLNVKDTNIKRTGKFTLNEDGSLEGDVRMELTGQYAITYRLNKYDEEMQKRVESLENEIKGRLSTAVVSNVRIEDFDDNKKPVVQSFSVKIPNYAQKTGKRMFLQPGFFAFGTTPKFSASERKYDIVFEYPWSESDNFEIKLPDGYELDNADTPAPMFDEQRIGSLEIDIGFAKDRNTLIYNREFYFGRDSILLLPKTAYAAVKGMFDGFHKNDTHTISLKAKAE